MQFTQPSSQLLAFLCPCKGCPFLPRRAIRARCTYQASGNSASSSASASGVHSGSSGVHSRALAAAVLAVALASTPLSACAEHRQADLAPQEVAATAADATTPIYFGNGCFWGRQHDFVQLEQKLGRKPEQISSVVGYAGGKGGAGAGGKVCYYSGAADTVYEDLGHAEVVQFELHGGMGSAKEQMRSFADLYFSQFRRTPFGMLRLDPQDAGPAYRNIVGLPGGVNSPLFAVLKERNVNGMELRPSNGSDFDQRGQPTDPDRINVIYIVDSSKLPFYRAEQYHQFHNGLGKAFPASYREDLKRVAAEQGRVGPTGCSESTGWF